MERETLKLSKFMSIDPDNTRISSPLSKPKIHGETSPLYTQPQECCSGMVVHIYSTPKKAQKDWCEMRRKICIVSEVSFSTIAMPAYLQLPGKPTVVNLKDLSDNC